MRKVGEFFAVADPFRWDETFASVGFPACCEEVRVGIDVVVAYQVDERDHCSGAGEVKYRFERGLGVVCRVNWYAALLAPRMLFLPQIS